jgi:hypothetical protein
MFPRVLGYLAGRAAAIAVDLYQRIQGSDQNQNNPSSTSSFVPAAIATVGILALPAPLRIPATLGGLALPYLLREVRELVETQGSSDGSTRSLECYLKVAEQSDPILLSTAATYPFAQCEER